MKYSKDITADFVKDFKMLLSKYQATIRVDDSDSNESKQDIKMMVYVPSQWDYDNEEQTVEYTEIDLGVSFPFHL